MNAEMRIEDAAKCKDEEELEKFVSQYLRAKDLKLGTFEAARARSLILLTWQDRNFEKKKEAASTPDPESQSSSSNKKKQRGSAWQKCQDYFLHNSEDYE